MKKIAFLLSMISFSAFCEEKDTMMLHNERELAVILTELRGAESNADKAKANTAFKLKLEELIENESALTYNFTLLSTVGIIDSPDELIRIINWNVEQEDFSHKYFCYVLRKDPKKKRYFFKELKDISFGMPSMPSEIITGDQWYGALYYDIIPVKKGSRTLYTVLGWDHHTELSTLKIVDVIYFSGTQVKLGNPIFRTGNTTTKRIFYEFAEKTSMLLKYEEDRERIMMDHLSPESPSMANFREFYVPDLSYDALIHDGSKWVLKEDVIGTNPEESEEEGSVYTMNEDGFLEEKEYEEEWRDPSNPHAPAGGNVHVAVTPEGDDETNKKRRKKNKTKSSTDEPKYNKRDKRDPSNLSMVNGTVKKKWWQRKKKKN